MPEKQGRVPKVLIVSNLQTTGPLWVFSLQQQKLNVLLEAEPARTLQRCEAESPDLIVIDANLSEAQTLELVQSLRAEMITPIILLTSARSEEHVIEAYKAGADDCILKPVSPSLFQAKVRVWLRRAGGVATEELDPLKAGSLHLFPSERMVFLANGGAARLTNLELRLLYYLMSQAGRTVTADELIQRVWGYSGEEDHAMLKNLVYRLRRKVEADSARPLIIQTVAGAGYRLAPE
jgi:DNA-binding response OmpR family regulator